MDPRRRDLVVAQIERLKKQRARLERDWSLIPRLGFSAVLIVPAYLLWGIGAAFAAVLFVPALMGVAAYLVGVRRFENNLNIRELEQAIAEHDAEIALAHPSVADPEARIAP